MNIVTKATYKKGTLVLDQSLGLEKEGKKFKIIIVEEETTHVKKERFLQYVEKHAFTLPKDYKFNREEIYER
ncbi:hypothetical protein [Candidatus Kuenenia sp.]|uniref:hypothetical protein n=1 Tax=Candidatus Kuenenia sp. TaxID=2499824 RepID=UPI0032201FB3